RIDRHSNSAEAAQAYPCPQVLKPIGSENRHAIAKADPDLGEGITDAVALPIELGIREWIIILKLDEWLVAALAHLARQHVADDPARLVGCQACASSSLADDFCLHCVVPTSFGLPNAGAHLLPEAAATQERRLEAVRCSALFGAKLGWEPSAGVTSP